LWAGYAAVGGGWEGEGMLVPALSGGVGLAAARVSAAGTVQWGAAPSVWLAPRAAWSLGRGWALQLDLSTGYDASAPTFVSGGATAAALGRLWVRPEVGLAWGPRYAGGTPVR
jgi:hypothetical protein